MSHPEPRATDDASFTDEKGNFWTLPALLADLESGDYLYLTPKMGKDLAELLRSSLVSEIEHNDRTGPALSIDDAEFGMSEHREHREALQSAVEGKTPRTDAAQAGLAQAVVIVDDWKNAFEWMCGHARSLERELARSSERDTDAALPDCMMPDGADPCEGFKQLQTEAWIWRKRAEEAEARLAASANELTVNPDMLAALKDYSQNDIDGVWCGVSRQALEEAIGILEKLKVAAPDRRTADE